MDKTTFKRQELYDLVWSEPLLRLSKKYNITDNGLRKICKRMNIPLPDNGYWQKKQYNKPVIIKELPQDYTGSEEINLVVSDNANPINTTTNHVKSILKSNETIDQTVFKIPARLTNPDKLITAAQKTLNSLKASEWSGGIVNTYFDEIAIKVAPTNVSRALLLFDTIIKILRFKGHNIIVRDRETYVVIEGETIEIALREKLRVEKIIDKNGWNTNKYFPTNKLIFRVDKSFCAKEFEDGKTLLEDKLHLIIAEIEYRGQKEKQQRIENQIRWKKEAEILRLEKERKARKDKEILDFSNLVKESKNWHESVILENYINEVERRAIDNNTLTEELKTWLQWAKQKSEWFNPFIKKEDEFLDENDRFVF